MTDGVAFEACFNFRDLAGWPTHTGATVARGQLYRSDSLHRMTPADLRTFGELGIRTVLDLRADDERAALGSLPGPPPGVTLRSLPMVDRVAAAARVDVVPPLGERAERYLRMAADGAPLIGDAFGVLTRPGALPAVFHCAAGRDRTGVFAALVLLVLGVDDDSIVADYALTQDSKAATDEWVARHEPATIALWSRYPADLRTTYAETMQIFLHRFRQEYGTVEAYLAAAGVQPIVLEDLRSQLLES